MSIFLRILYIIILLVVGFILLVRYTDFKYKFGDYLLNLEKKLDKKVESLDDDIKRIEKEAAQKDYLLIKKFMAKQVSKNRIPVIELFFENKLSVYQIIGYKHYVSFKRCKSDDYETEIVDFKSLDELFQSELFDGVCLERDWSKLKNWKIGLLQ